MQATGAPRRTNGARLFLRSFAQFGVVVAVTHLVVVHYGLLFAVTFVFVAAKLGWLRLLTLLFSALLSTQSSSAAYREALRRADTMVEPVTEKHSLLTEGKALSFGLSCMQGWRRTMEDAHTALIIETETSAASSTASTEGGDSSASKAQDSGKTGSSTKLVAGSTPAPSFDGTAVPPGGFFAVFDGHCGSTIAQFCGNHLFRFVVQSPEFRGAATAGAGGDSAALNGTKHGCDYAAALRSGFVSIDKHLSSHDTYRHDRSGCTAVAVWVLDDMIYCANAGDSRAILCRNTGPVIPLSNDHKPNLPGEQRRIELAGGIVRNKRVNGVLALSRAIGDFSFKQNWMIPWEDQAVTCVPEVTTTPRTADDAFIVLACDGIWDVKTNDQVASFVRPRLKSGVSPVAVAELLMQNCLSPHPFGLGCDNMSVVIVVFRENGTIERGSATAASVNGTTASANSSGTEKDGETDKARNGGTPPPADE